MKPEIATLCRYASDRDGSLTIVDTFERMTVDRLPFKADFYFVFKISLDGLSAGQHKIVMDITGGRDGGDGVFSRDYDFTMRDNMESLACTSNLKGLVFNAPGTYCVRVSFDGEVVISQPLKLLLKNER